MPRFFQNTLAYFIAAKTYTMFAEKKEPASPHLRIDLVIAVVDQGRVLIEHGLRRGALPVLHHTLPERDYLLEQLFLEALDLLGLFPEAALHG